MFQWKCSRGGAPNPFNHQKWMTHISFVWQKISKFQLYFCQDKFQLYLYETEISGLESMEDFSYEHRQWLPVLYLKFSPTVNIEEGAGDDAVDVASVLAHVLKKYWDFADFFKSTRRFSVANTFFSTSHYYCWRKIGLVWTEIIGRGTMLAQSWPAPRPIKHVINLRDTHKQNCTVHGTYIRW